MKNLEKKARAYALKNALAYNGKARQGFVISSLFNEGLKKEDVKKYAKKISEIISEVNSLKLEQQKKEFENLKKQVAERKGREGLAELPNAKKGKVVMRISPSPSGPFHIGHALVFCLNFLYVKKYGGKFYVRIEDTNPENIFPKAYKMIEEESKWLSEGLAKIVIQSDRMEIYYKYAQKLINKGDAYVCECSGDDFRKHVSAKENCPCRNLEKKTQKERWKKMLDKKGYKPGEVVLRFKSNMKDKNPAMRDFPLARINLEKHPRVGNKYRVWPLMNLAVSVDDIELGMTHVIRGKDHMDNAKRQEMIYKSLGKKFPWVGFLGKFKFKDLELSTTKIRQDIENGKYSGWDDPRLPTIAALRKKYKPQAFWKFAEQIGLSENDKVIDKKEYFLLLDNFNK
ncbi:MAG: glutamate--tRNA ligase [Nanoarchaeota archaeon]|nr:glutamate--tRNA ligase [Nanoarchaeota archaeon]